MQLLTDMKAALKATRKFNHIASTTLVNIKSGPAVVLEPKSPETTQDDKGDVVVNELKFEVTVAVSLESMEVKDAEYDKKLDELIERVADVKTVMHNQHQGVKYSNELIDPLLIDNKPYLVWMFDAQMIFA